VIYTWYLCTFRSLPYHAMPFCDPTAEMDTRAADMVSRMTLQVRCMVGSFSENRGSTWHSVSRVLPGMARKLSPTTLIQGPPGYPHATCLSLNDTLQ